MSERMWGFKSPLAHTRTTHTGVSTELPHLASTKLGVRLIVLSARRRNSLLSSIDVGQ